MILILKIIFIVLLVILLLAKIEKEIIERDTNFKMRLLDIIEIIISIVLIFFIYKI